METGIIIGGFFVVIFGALFVQRIMRDRRDRQVPMFAIHTCPDRAHVKVLGAAVASDGIPLLRPVLADAVPRLLRGRRIQLRGQPRGDHEHTVGTIPFLLMDGTVVLLPQDRVLVYAYAMRQPGLAGATVRLLEPPPGSLWKIESVT